MDQFILDFRNITVLISLAIHASLLWVLFRYGRKTPGGKAYVFAILAIAGWVFPMFLYRSNFLGEAVLWVRILYIMASFTSTTFFYFTLVFPEDKKISFKLKLFLLLENLFVVYLCIHPTWMIKGVELVDKGEDIILWGPLYFLYANHVSFFFLLGFIVLFLKFRKEKGMTRRQILFILSGYFFGANLAMVTNLILPWFGNFEYNWLGQFFSTLVAAFTTYAILRYKLLDIKMVATEAFLLLLNFLLLIRLLFSKDYSDVLVNVIVFILVLFVSFILFLSVKKEIKQKEELASLAHNLEKANLRLQELDQQKTEFLSIASHQLRTPLTIIRGYIELIGDGAYGKVHKPLKEVLKNMDESNDRLMTLVEEFLDITRIEQGRTKFTFEDKNMNELISSVVKELSMKPEFAVKKLKIVWKPDKEITNIYMDEEKVRHVVFNFLDNAIKYSDKGTITISVETEDGGYTVRVKDHGFGFNKEDEVNFFQKFYRGKNVEGTNVNGTGLGIYVCKRFIEKHGGHVWAHSPGLGQGSEFGFWIPGVKGKE
ncbi:MAG: hypothetical protein COX80_00395 [Candidatus Magasanikbacteria bacterium CG_4_10_14_0_2_um_filter_33_14]|uniref:histidine kinase n=1 Tax=Candidatus Magasanikbacteria bacterium CG_4_10_14_0_2_um_filter_33_14 TaxID=1974636 RepID=A0A2M7VBZ4_9BACT|nr:MAG: hypothetical protein COX80_00395 [Candidatus Magasanikbacteria bacterium CG_4_10_14_0_2_um_filter_33_14]